MCFCFSTLTKNGFFFFRLYVDRTQFNNKIKNNGKDPTEICRLLLNLSICRLQLVFVFSLIRMLALLCFLYLLIQLAVNKYWTNIFSSLSFSLSHFLIRYVYVFVFVLCVHIFARCKMFFTNYVHKNNNHFSYFFSKEYTEEDEDNFETHFFFFLIVDFILFFFSFRVK